MHIILNVTRRMMYIYIPNRIKYTKKCRVRLSPFINRIPNAYFMYLCPAHCNQKILNKQTYCTYRFCMWAKIVWLKMFLAFESFTFLFFRILLWMMKHGCNETDFAFCCKLLVVKHSMLVPLTRCRLFFAMNLK